MSIRFEAVSAGYGGRKVLDGVTASFEAGKVTGIVGPNGAGKTTLLRVGLGLMARQGGTVQICDRPQDGWSRAERARKIAYLPQGGEAHWPVTAREVVLLGRLPHRTAFAPVAQADLDAVDAALERCDAAMFATRRMNELSAGERARVLFARALATGAPVLLADEPAAYLDPSHQLRLMALLRDEAARGTAVAVTLHDLALASRHCDEIVVLHQGRIAAQGKPEDALADPVLRDVFGIAAERAPSGAVVALARV